ncbi:hypothetical protein DFP72DRAFT_1066525 [Ephemerocybe angulata]|uniref:Uncharacterized protein n=1 Tax=Ephemerocybe angulata TaxID=980116 RepID=A0A8H6HLE2_9AGAR|nr:hypothetical protein DFP72DRAFT_1073711 [Tulosesus angulatus]KAF6756634.1 hypothetical protein DFP72DRAFT_1066525 [Tulosesus angulatus]
MDILKVFPYIFYAVCLWLLAIRLSHLDPGDVAVIGGQHYALSRFWDVGVAAGAAGRLVGYVVGKVESRLRVAEEITRRLASLGGLVVMSV